MRKFSTMLSCLCLAIFGAVVGLNNKSPAVTANAAPTFSYLPRDLQLPKIKYDTIYMTKDSIIPCKKNHYPKRKEVRIPYAVRDTLYVPVVTTIILRDRKESSQDSTTCTVIHDNSIQVQKPIEIPDSITVRPVEYKE